MHLIEPYKYFTAKFTQKETAEQWTNLCGQVLIYLQNLRNIFETIWNKFQRFHLTLNSRFKHQKTLLTLSDVNPHLETFY